MSSRAEMEKQRQIQDKCQTILGNLLREEDNKYCVDCDAKGPRWASWNLGIFLCIRCAGIHRNLGVHISKVKSVNLDTWTPEQVAFLQQMGNSQARAVYEANLPDNFRRPQTDSSLEAFVRAKYEQKKYIAKEWVPPPTPKPAFNIDEEKRREREKRKSRGKVTNTVEIPTLQQPSALPRPHSAGALSPSPITVSSESKQSQTQQQSSNTADLLSLDVSNVEQSDDLFDAFLSAPLPNMTVSDSTMSTSQPAPNEITVSPSNKNSDEADFFNQTGVLDASKSNKMTKESILSLYGTGGTQPQNPQPQPSIYGLSGGMYVSPPVYLAPNMTSIPTPSAQAVVPNGIVNVASQIPCIQPSGVSVATVCNPFSTMGTSVMTQDVNQHSGSWVSSPAGSGANPTLVAQGFGQQLQQQMANLQISGQSWNVQGVTQVPATGIVISGQPPTGMSWPTATHGQTLSTNLWQ